MNQADPFRDHENSRVAQFERALMDDPGLLELTEPVSKQMAQQGISTNVSWPSPLAPQAFHGIAGELVKTIEPHTEADAAALLTQFLTGIGNLVGRGAYTIAGADRHCANLFTCIVGKTSRGRKGSSWSQIRRVLSLVDEAWAANNSSSTGLSTGEGLIDSVKDPAFKSEPVREDGKIVRYEDRMTDKGVEDKRFLIIESELAGPLASMRREGNNLSAVLRSAWDEGNLKVTTRNTRAKATGAQISMIAHITRDELLRLLSTTEQSNGFGNRILWVCAKRSKLLPEGGSIRDVNLSEIVKRLRQVSVHAQSIGELRRDEEAREIWKQVYPRLTEPRMGLFGAITGRAEAQVLRLSLVYALLDCANAINPEHLLAALAVWDYCEASCRFIFGDAVGDPIADPILNALRGEPGGMSKTEIFSLFQRNQSAASIDRALAQLQEHGLAIPKRIPSDGGRPQEVWFAVDYSTKETNLTKKVP